VKALVPREWSERRCICRRLGRPADSNGTPSTHLFALRLSLSLSLSSTAIVAAVELFWRVLSSWQSAGDVECGPGFVLVQAIVLLQCPFDSSAIKWGRRTRVVPSSCTPAPR
jgi:hypothetical protein